MNLKSNKSNRNIFKNSKINLNLNKKKYHKIIVLNFEFLNVVLLIYFAKN